MATLAFIYLAYGISQETLNPFVTWVFSTDACISCSTTQLEVMDHFLEPGDQIVISDPTRDSTQRKTLHQMIQSKFPKDVILISPSRRQGIMTGWIWMDPVTGEEVVFKSKDQHYNALRANSLLAVFRSAQ